MAAPTLRGIKGIGASSQDAVLIDPGNALGTLVGELPQVGDWMIAELLSSDTLANTKTFTLPADWIPLVPMRGLGSGTASFGLYAHIRKSGETTYSFPYTGGTAFVVNRLMWGAGADPDISKWQVGTFANRSSNATQTTALAPSLNVTKAESLALHLMAERTTATETEAQVTQDNPAFTRRFWESNSTYHGTISTREMSVPGETGTITTTVPNAHANNAIAGFVALPTASVAPAPNLGLKVKITGNPSSTSRLKVVGANSALVTPGAVKTVAEGYDTVTEMMAQNFRVAHRGGSQEFPEMSSYAYGQSALLGFGALELSLGRTSDGVWFGHHDETLARVTGGASSAKPSDLTWAQVQQLNILASSVPLNKNQPDRPFKRWEELVELYYDSHVIFVDPKFTMPFRQELYGMMESLPGNPRETFVGKFYGVLGNAGNTDANFAKEMQALGYKTWGYFYEVDVPQIPTYAGRWTMLGMDYGASQSAWDAVKAQGKKVIGHIVPNLAAANTALSKGADALMVSGVKTIPPRA